MHIFYCCGIPTPENCGGNAVFNLIPVIPSEIPAECHLTLGFRTALNRLLTDEWDLVTFGILIISEANEKVDIVASRLLSVGFVLKMSSAHFLEEALDLELIDKNLYRSTKPLWHPPHARGIFGGAVIAQALSAALKTVNASLHVHSLHSYFVLGYSSSTRV